MKGEHTPEDTIPEQDDLFHHHYTESEPWAGPLHHPVTMPALYFCLSQVTQVSLLSLLLSNIGYTSQLVLKNVWRRKTQMMAELF